MDNPEFRARIDELAAGFTRSRIVFTAVNADLFRYLEGPVRAEDVAHELGWDVRGTRMLLDGLVALELIEKYGQDYCNAPIAAQCLVPGAPMDQTNILGHRAHGWAAWSRLDEAVKNGTPVVDIQNRPHDEMRDFILGMDDIARQSAEAVLDAVDLCTFKEVLDIGGGPASYPIAFLKRYPAMAATIMDTNPVLEIAKGQVRNAGLLDRFTFLPADITCDALPPGHDLIFISNVIHMLGPDTNRSLVQRCFDALEPGGLLIIKDFLTDDDHSSPAFSLLFALQMLLHTEAGDTYAANEVAGWTRAAGFADGRLIELTPQTRLWLAQKP